MFRHPKLTRERVHTYSISMEPSSLRAQPKTFLAVAFHANREPEHESSDHRGETKHKSKLTFKGFEIDKGI